MPEPAMPPVLGMPSSLGGALLGGALLGGAPVLSLGAPDEPVLGDGLGAVLPGVKPVLVSLADEPVLPGAVVDSLGLEPVLGAPMPPEVACATITPPSGGA